MIEEIKVDIANKEALLAIMVKKINKVIQVINQTTEKKEKIL